MKWHANYGSKPKNQTPKEVKRTKECSAIKLFIFKIAEMRV